MSAISARIESADVDTGRLELRELAVEPRKLLGSDCLAPDSEQLVVALIGDAFVVAPAVKQRQLVAVVDLVDLTLIGVDLLGQRLERPLGFHVDLVVGRAHQRPRDIERDPVEIRCLCLQRLQSVCQPDDPIREIARRSRLGWRCIGRLTRGSLFVDYVSYAGSKRFALQIEILGGCEQHNRECLVFGL